MSKACGLPLGSEQATEEPNPYYDRQGFFVLGKKRPKRQLNHKSDAEHELLQQPAHRGEPRPGPGGRDGQCAGGVREIAGLQQKLYICREPHRLNVLRSL